MNYPKSTLLLVIVFSVACQPPKGSRSAEPGRPIQFGIMSAVAPECVTRIKGMMMNREVLFQDLPQTKIDDQAEQLNRIIQSGSLTEVDYSIERDLKTKDVSSISINWEKPSHFDEEKRQLDEESFEVSLGASDETAAWPLELTLQYKRSKDGQTRELHQTYNVSKSCELRVASASSGTLIQRSQNTISASGQTFSLHGGDEVSASKDVVIPQDAIWNENLPAANSLEDLTRVFSQIRGKLVMMISAISPEMQNGIRLTDKMTDIANNPVTKKSEPLSGFRGHLEVRGERAIDLEMLFSRSSSFRMIRIAGKSETLTVDHATWVHARPTKTSEVTTKIVKVDESLFEKSGSLLLRVSASQPLKFDNRPAYWREISSKQLNGKEEWKVQYAWESILVLPPQQLPKLSDLVKSEQSQRYLKDTKFVQLSIPELAPVKAKLKINPEMTTVEVAQDVLRVVNETLVYDNSMVEENTVTPLTTKLILEGKTGVCQHFANLFAALARGVGLPTRIISGFLISGEKLERHAWVEVEIQPAVWFPIEPQSVTLKTDFSRYLPMAASEILDTGDYSSIEFDLEYKMLGFTSLKVEGRKPAKRN